MCSVLEGSFEIVGPGDFAELESVVGHQWWQILLGVMTRTGFTSFLYQDVSCFASGTGSRMMWTTFAATRQHKSTTQLWQFGVPSCAARLTACLQESQSLGRSSAEFGSRGWHHRLLRSWQTHCGRWDLRQSRLDFHGSIWWVPSGAKP